MRELKRYKTLDNGGKPFLVEIKENTVKVYSVNPELDTKVFKKHHYKNFIKEWKVKKVFVGNSPKNEMTIYSGGYGKKWYGNSILLELDNSTYAFIGHCIYEFKTDDKK